MGPMGSMGTYGLPVGDLWDSQGFVGLQCCVRGLIGITVYDGSTGLQCRTFGMIHGVMGSYGTSPVGSMGT